MITRTHSATYQDGPSCWLNYMLNETGRFLDMKIPVAVARGSPDHRVDELPVSALHEVINARGQYWFLDF